jgi:hypothetical protein
VYWKRQSVPELAGLDADELKRYWVQRYSASYRQPGYWAASCAITILCLLLGWGIAHCPLSPLLLVLGIAALGMTPFVALDQVTVHFARPRWRKMREGGD